MSIDDGSGFLNGPTGHHKVVGGVDGIAEMIEHLLVSPTASIAGPAEAMSWSVGARPAASHIGIRALTSLRTSASTRFARPSAAGGGGSARHRERRDDVRLTRAAAGLGLRGPRPSEDKASAGDRPKQPVPHFGVAVPEDDGHDAVVGHDSARLANAFAIMSS